MEEEAENIWSSLLSQVQTYSPTKLPNGKYLLVLGDNESGKTSLVAKLQGIEDPKKGSGLEYHYLTIRDDYRDDQTRLGIWILDGEPWHRNLLKFILNEETLPHTTVLLIAAMSEPWNILDSLESWVTILQEHLDRIKLSPDVLKQCQFEVQKKYNNYVEPGEDIFITSYYRSVEAEPKITDKDTLSHNLGLEIVVVITKTDCMSMLEKELDYKDEHFDFIQQALRKFCLKYGASLIYTSVKEDKNCDVLWKYLLHKIYDFPFRTPALVVDRDIIFIPSGWDSQKKIAILYENLACVAPDDSYNTAVSRPLIKRSLYREVEVYADSDQAFLMKLVNVANQPIPPTSKMVKKESPLRNPIAVQKLMEKRSISIPLQSSTPKKMDSKPTTGSEQLLHNFFSSLLKKPSGSSSFLVSDKSPINSTSTLESSLNRNDAGSSSSERYPS
ncbi:cytoplasmic dynein 1 light intermediate chain 1-like isoform X1 [Centruroides sculpturatus]|uniref:cytoplasmic dynein 1 light intermediate chain 1-like isoform X1 n=1 Tax=Centruroides sculpturatus TaxID=218467 RepID=UPI000C6CA439|nr:cytoplasmic dynein 1 light intermediate chain 1-like isoform X1 [Centruroides sculpturatus]